LVISLAAVPWAPAQTWTYDFVAAKGTGLAVDAASSSPLTKASVGAGRDERVGCGGQAGAGDLKVEAKEWPKTAAAAALVLEYYDKASPPD